MTLRATAPYMAMSLSVAAGSADPSGRHLKWTIAISIRPTGWVRSRVARNSGAEMALHRDRLAEVEALAERHAAGDQRVALRGRLDALGDDRAAVPLGELDQCPDRGLACALVLDARQRAQAQFEEGRAQRLHGAVAVMSVHTARRARASCGFRETQK